MNNLPNIPSPPSHYWREFRHSFVPYITFAAVLLAAVVLWNKRVSPSNIVGEAEAIRASLTTVEAGTLVELNVTLLQRVKKGDVIGKVTIMDSDTVKASKAAIEADLEVLRARLIQDMERNKLSYQQLRFDSMQRHIDLSTARVELQHAENEFQRNYKLLQERAVAEVDVENWRNLRDIAKTKVEELTKMVADTDVEIERLKPPSGSQLDDTPFAKAISMAISAKQQELEALTDSSTLKAPFDGFVSAIYRHVGEKTVRGESVVIISAEASNRIVAFVRQPINYHPKVGGFVEVRSRAMERLSVRAKITHVGSQLEPITPTLIPLTSAAPAPPAAAAAGSTATARISEMGLQMLVEIPNGFSLVPGETVDIIAL